MAIRSRQEARIVFDKASVTRSILELVELEANARRDWQTHLSAAAM